MIGMIISISLFILGIFNNNQWIGLIDMGLSFIFYLAATYHIRWEKTFNEVRIERNKGGKR